MNCFSLHPEDARWLIRWLRGNVLGMLLIGTALLTLHRAPAWLGQLAGSPQEQPPGVSDSRFSLGQSSVERSLSAPSAAGSVAVAPQGWRRTANGWEDTSTWPRPAQPLAYWIERQQEREPVWMRQALAMLREIPPLAFAFAQLAAIATIVAISRPRITGAA